MQGKPGAQKQPAVAAATVIQTHIVERLACANMEQVMRNRAVVFVPVVARFERRVCRYSTPIVTGTVTTLTYGFVSYPYAFKHQSIHEVLPLQHRVLQHPWQT